MIETLCRLSGMNSTNETLLFIHVLIMCDVVDCLTHTTCHCAVFSLFCKCV